MALSPAHEVAHGVVLKKNSSTGEAELCQTGPTGEAELCQTGPKLPFPASSNSCLYDRRKFNAIMKRSALVKKKTHAWLRPMPMPWLEQKQGAR
jgi:hypothetical protein